MKRRTIIGFLLLVGAVAVAGIVGTGGGPLSKNWLRGNTETNESHAGSSTLIVQSSTVTVSAGYKYYILKDTRGFLLARARKGAYEEPLETPQTLLPFGSDFGRSPADSVTSLTLSPDGRYLAIDGSSDHGEMVWIYDTHARTLYMAPQHVAGNFLHWLPGGSGHTFLYRPVLPQGPGAPFDGGAWNPGLWLVDAATGEHRNLAIGVPSVDLIDAVPSPDGQRIIYSTTAGLGQGSAVFLMKRDGSERRHLFTLEGGAEARAIAGLFRWSPDGAHIAYERLSDSVIPFLPAGLWLMNAQGTEQRWLADVDGGHGFRPVWSPDSRSIACVVRTNVDDHLADMQAQALQSAIGVVEVQSRRFWLAASPAQTQVQWNINPTWTADSASITFTALNPLNRIVGGTPRYWSVQIDGHHTLPVLKPLTQPLQHIIALS